MYRNCRKIEISQLCKEHLVVNSVKSLPEIKEDSVRPQRPAGGASCSASQPLRKPTDGVWSSAAGPPAVRLMETTPGPGHGQ